VAADCIFECVLCGTCFGFGDVERGRFFPSTLICLRCYKRGQGASYKVWCFGKPNVVGASGKILEFGYDVRVAACREHCPDRNVCAKFSVDLQERTMESGKGAHHRGIRLPFREAGCLGARAFIKCMDGILINDLVRWVSKQGGDPRRILRLMRSGNLYGQRWLVNEQNGYLKIDYSGENSKT